MVLVARTISKKKLEEVANHLSLASPSLTSPPPQTVLSPEKADSQNTLLSLHCAACSIMPSNWALERPEIFLPPPGLSVVENKSKFYQVSQDCRDNDHSPHSPHPLPLLSYFTKPLWMQWKKTRSKKWKSPAEQKGEGTSWAQAKLEQNYKITLLQRVIKTPANSWN